MKRSLICCLILSPLLMHCAEDAGTPAPPAAPLVSAPIQLVGATVCSIDEDCDAGLSCFLGACAAQCTDGSECASGLCDTRGLCELSAEKAAPGGAPVGPPAFRLTGVSLVGSSDTVVPVLPGQQFVTVALETSGPVLAQGGFAYRVESPVDPGAASRIVVSGDATHHLIDIDTGIRGESETIGDGFGVRLVTPLGDIPLVLKAAPAVSGHYEGTLELAGLGAKVPLSFGIQANGPDLVAGTTQAYLVVGATTEDVFSPIDSSDLPTPAAGGAAVEVVVAPLTYEADLDRWVARFRNGFNIQAGESFGGLPRGQIRRELRYELKRELDGSFSGTLTDRFSGLYDAASSDGTVGVSEGSILGAFTVNRSGDEPTVATTATAIPSAPAVRGFDLSADCESLAAEFADCATVGTFAGATACAEALGAGTIGDDTLTDVVAGLLGGGLTEDGQTFEQFLESCADGSEAKCVPSAEAACALEMHAVAIGLAPGGWSETKEQLWSGFSALQLQTNGGPQLGALYLDVNMRRQWLENATYGLSAVTAAAAAQLNAQLMDDYFNQVVEVNARALRGYMAPSTFAFLSRGPDSASARDQRDNLLASMVGSWTSAADSLALAAQRWNELYRLDGQRRIKANLIAGRLRELYVDAAVIIQLHQQAGKAAEAAPIAASLANLLQRQATLTKTFKDLLFDRYGQVTTSASLDPSKPANSILQQRREAALEAVDDASQRVDTILANLLQDDIRNQDFSNKLDDRVATSEGFLVELCGQPVGCDILDPEAAPAPGGECEVSWEPGVCGFDQPRGPLEDRTPRSVLGFESAASPSVAGLAIKDIKQAAIDLETSQTSLTQFLATTKAMEQTTSAFAASTARWHDEAQTNANRINTILTQETARQSAQLKLHLTHLKANEARWTASLAARKKAADEWNALSASNANVQITAALISTVSTLISDLGEQLGENSTSLTDQIKTGVPGVVGLATDAFAAVRMALGLGTYATKTTLQAIGFTAHRAAAYTDMVAEMAQVSFEKNLANSETNAETAEFERETQRAIEELQDDREQAVDPVVAAQIEQLISNLDRQLEVRQAYERDLVELDDRRNELLSRTVELAERLGAVAHAAVAFDTAVLEYYRNCELARQEKSALDMTRGFRSSIHQLIAGPQAFFASANSLVEAERELDRAKRKMADWLVAIEFAAVRPFFNERMAILLARNTYQLRAIADRLRDLEDKCGGPTNLQRTVISVRDDLLGLRDSQTDPVTRRVLSPGDRFWKLAQNSPLPQNTEMRYSAVRGQETVASGTRGNNDLFVMNVQLSQAAFANLSHTCNAKIESIGVRLVGDGLGSGQPMVTILYGGQSSMYSCQPGIDAYVAAFTNAGDPVVYGANSAFVSAARAISPVAGIGAMGAPNQTLAGMPLASDYTILIDPFLPANRGIDWTKLNDVQLEVTYSYQDLFATGSECASSL